MRHFTLMAALCGLMLAAGGCASAPKTLLTRQNTATLRGATVSHTQRDFPALTIYSTKDATFGMLGGAIGGAIAGAMQVGDKKVNADIVAAGVANPIDVFRTALLGELQARYAMVDQGSAGVTLDAKQALDLAASATKSDYILDARVGWMCSYQPTNWTRYIFQFGFSAKLVRRATGEVMFEDTFSWKTPKELGFPSQAEFLTDQSKGVAAQIRAACDAAKEHFSKLLPPPGS